MKRSLRPTPACSVCQTSRTAVGRQAEQRVARWLSDRGWVVLGTNVRVGHDELDVVALDGTVLVIVEVRARRPGSAHHPFETIDPRKAARLRRAAAQYMAEHNATEIRIDVVAVIGEAIEIIENAIDFTST